MNPITTTTTITMPNGSTVFLENTVTYGDWYIIAGLIVLIVLIFGLLVNQIASGRG